MDAKLVEMASARVGVAQIANAIGVYRTAVRKRRDEMGLPKGKPPGPKPKPRQPAGTVVVRLIEY